MPNPTKQTIWVYAHWKGLTKPLCIGELLVQQSRGTTAYSFQYDASWLKTEAQRLLDPDIWWYSGPQYPVDKTNFGVFLDSMPDRWGRTLLKRKSAREARKKSEPTPTLRDVDFLLGVFDETRMGALRFKTAPDGPFLDNDTQQAIPPWSSVRTLQYAADQIEQDTGDSLDEEWLNLLIAPGTSLGGARPKANIQDTDGSLWIAKFPSGQDDIDKGAWEYLLHLLAIRAGIDMAPSRLEKIQGRHHTFFTKRFDREENQRIHFASAMTMLGRTEQSVRESPASYLELAEFVQYNGCSISEDLAQLWRRIVFNILVSNTDDHLRNHGFLLTEKGWRLSPAYDLNPAVGSYGLSLNINLEDNALDLDLAREVGPFFQLSKQNMERIIEEVKSVVRTWRSLASESGIRRREQEMMAEAFKQ